MPAALAIAGIGAVLQGGLGAIQAIGGNKDARELRKKRKAYQTPEEIYKMLQLAQSRASTGFDPFTLNYLTNQTDRAFDSTLDTARLLGADPNALGAAFDAKVNSIIKIGAENHALNMENISRLYSAYDIVAANKAAEQKSQQDMLKDDIQSATAEKAAGIQNIGNAFNTFLGAVSSAEMMNLYKDKKKKNPLSGVEI